jgi:integrase/recombinase XerD
MDDNRSHSDSGVLVLGEEFLARIDARRYSPRTVEVYRQAIRDFDRFLQTREIKTVEAVTSAIIEDYRRHLQGRGFSPAGEETYTRAVKRFFDDLERRQRVFENPFDGTGPMRRAKKLIPVPGEAEIAALLAVPDTASPVGLRNRAILETAYSTGARLEELSRMKFADLDLPHGTVRIMGKGQRERVVPLGKAAAEWIARYVSEVRTALASAGTAQLWVRQDGGPLGSLSIGLAVRRCASRAGTATKITPHGLRRACATHMLGRGAHPVQIQMLLGHSSLKHLSAYLRVTFRELQAMHERSRVGQ